MPLPDTTNTTRPQSHGFLARIDERYLRLAPSRDMPNAFETAETEIVSPRTEENPEEFRPGKGRTYSRSDFTGGQGLDFAHARDAEEEDVRRFFASSGVQALVPSSGQTRELSLLRTTASLRASTVAAQYLAVSNAGRVVLADAAAAVSTSTNPLAASPTWASEDPKGADAAAVTPRGLAAYGDEFYLATQHGIHQRQSAGTWRHYADGDYGLVFVVKDRVLAVTNDGRSLHQFVTNGTPPIAAGTALRTIAPGAAWVDAVDAGAAVLVAATDGNIYAFAPDNTGALVQKAQTTGVAGEQPMALAAVSGVVFYATRELNAAGGYTGRLWRAELNDTTLTLGDAQLVAEWLSTTTLHAYPRKLITTRSSVYMAVPNSDSSSNLWRYDLFTGGLFRANRIPHASAATTPLTRGLVELGGKLFAQVDGVGLFRETDLYESTGYVISALGDFFTAEEKSWFSAALEAVITTTGQNVELYYSTDPAALLDPNHASWVLAVTATASGRIEAGVADVSARYIAAKVVLNRGATTTQTPRARSFAFRGYPVSKEIIVQLAVNVSDLITRPGKQPVRVPGLGDRVYLDLVAREGQSVTVQLFRPDLTVVGVLERVGTRQQQMDERGSAVDRAVLQVRGRKQ